MRGLLKELWHRHLDRKPWVFRDRYGLGYLFSAEDRVAEYCKGSAVVDNPGFLAFLEKTVKPGEVFVDLSPVIGGVTMLVARQVTETGAVFAFAPGPEGYRQMVNNVALNGLTRTVRVIGREVLSSKGQVAALTLDDFSAQWNWPVVDYLRLKDVSHLDGLRSSAAVLFKSRRIRRLLLDDLAPDDPGTVSSSLSALGFAVERLSPDGKINLVATCTEAVHG